MLLVKIDTMLFGLTPFVGIDTTFFVFSSGELDNVPEVAFFMVGGIEEVIAKAERLATEQNWA